jgi:hypothetical protein
LSLFLCFKIQMNGTNIKNGRAGCGNVGFTVRGRYENWDVRNKKTVSSWGRPKKPWEINPPAACPCRDVTHLQGLMLTWRDFVFCSQDAIASGTKFCGEYLNARNRRRQRDEKPCVMTACSIQRRPSSETKQPLS